MVDAILIVPILQMKTLRYNNGKWCEANNNEDSMRTQSVSTIQYVQWSCFLTFQLSPELTFNPENLNMVHGVFCFWFEKRWVMECLEGSIWKMPSGKQSQGEISPGWLGKVRTGCHGCGPARLCWPLFEAKDASEYSLQTAWSVEGDPFCEDTALQLFEILLG